MYKVDELKEPLIVGKSYLVPCISYKVTDIGPYDEEEIWRDTLDHTIYRNVVVVQDYIVPILNHPHNDVENGQKEIHSHIDDRFISSVFSYPTGTMRVTKTENQIIDYIAANCIRTDIKSRTQVSFIKSSKLKHKCIYKGKCPHRGMDLSQVVPIEGIITCPLHGLKFKNNKLVE